MNLKPYKDLDFLCRNGFNFVCKITEEIVKTIKENNSSIKEMCNSETTSKPISDYLEQLTSSKIYSSKENLKVYMNTRKFPGRSDHDIVHNDKCVYHIDNKGVSLKKIHKKLGLRKVKKLLAENNIKTEKKDKWEKILKLTDENNLQGVIRKDDELYEEVVCEMMNDHLDEKFSYERFSKQFKKF